MLTKINIFNLLILLTLISFAFFGSLSHIFSLGLIVLSFSIWLSTEKSNWLDVKTVGLFLALTGCFLFFLIDSLVKKSIGHNLNLTSLGPILPIPIIGLLILFQAGKAGKDFDLTAEKITKYSHIAIFINLIVFLLISALVGSDPMFDQLQTTRVELFSGNPIPYSYVVQGISIFCLANWGKSNFKNKIIAFSFFMIGTVFSSFLSGTRGTLLSLLVISPLLFFYLCESIKLTLLACVVSGLTGVLYIQTGSFLFNNNIYFNSLSDGLDTLILSKNSDSSISHRLQMWSASIKAISKVPMFGYGIENKFQAIKPYLPTSFNSTYSHPHNDIMASIIAVGRLGGIAAFISLISGFLASFLTSNWSIEKVFLSLMISIPTLITSNLSTVFFNDISAAWLAFSTYLIWKLDFKNKTK